MTGGSDGELDQVPFDGGDAALVVSVAGGARAADDRPAVLPEPLRQSVHGIPAADGKGEVRVARAVRELFRIRHVRAAHDLQPRAVLKAEKVRAKARVFVVIAVAGAGAEIADKEVPCRFQVADIHGGVFDPHGSSSVNFRSVPAAPPLPLPASPG